MSNPRGQVVEADPTVPDAIHRAVASLGGGGRVLLPPGSYCLESPVVLPSDVALVGAGSQLTTITLAPGSSCHMFTNGDHDTGNQGIELRGFRLEGNMESQHRPPEATSLTFACGGYFKKVKGLVIDDVVGHAIRNTAFHFTDCTNVDVHRLEADELGWSGVSTSGTDDIVLRNVVVTNAGRDVRHSGIHLDGGRGAYIDAVVDGCTGNGIMLDSKYSPLSDVVVRGTARHSMHGLSLVGNEKHELTNVCVTGDYSDNEECGILVTSASNVCILDATIASNASAGVVVQGEVGCPDLVVSGCRITGSPDLLAQRDGCRIAFVMESTGGSAPDRVEPLSPSDVSLYRGRKPPPLAERVRNRVGRSRAGAWSAARRTRTPADDSFEGACNLCGKRQVFARNHRSLREGYRCTKCKASLRYRGQADAILRGYSTKGSTSIAELVRERDFKELSVWEPGVLGPFRAHFGRTPGYVMTDFWPDVPPGDQRDGVRCEDLMALTFPAASFDLVVTSDIFEHVRKPYLGFAEVHRVLRTGGRHIFSIPVHDPMPQVTVERVDTSGAEDVNILEPVYHLGPGHSHHIVYNDFGLDLVDDLASIGFDTEIIRFELPSREASRLLTFCSVKR